LSSNSSRAPLRHANNEGIRFKAFVSNVANAHAGLLMAQLTILYWRDIPSQIVVKAGRAAAKRELPERFIRAIDAAAMRAGASGTDAYLADWRRGDSSPCGDDIETEASAAAAGIEAEYDNVRLARLIAREGREESPVGPAEPQH
jgi:Virulence factor